MTKKIKQHAKIVSIAGQNEDGKKLYAIIDQCGHTEYQLWHHTGYINIHYILIT